MLNKEKAELIKKMSEKEEVKMRELSDVCEKELGAFAKCLRGNVYCKLAMGSRNVLCPYLSEECDHNGIRPCMNPDYETLKSEN